MNEQNKKTLDKESSLEKTIKGTALTAGGLALGYLAYNVGPEVYEIVQQGTPSQAGGYAMKQFLSVLPGASLGILSIGFLSEGCSEIYKGISQSFNNLKFKKTKKYFANEE